VTPILVALVRLFPADFRRRFGDDVREQIGEDWKRAAAKGGWTASWFAVVTALDLVASALAEHVNPTWTDDEISQQGEGWMMEDWIRDLAHAVRSLARTPGFAAVTVVTLGVAIGVNTGIFSVVDTVLLRALPYPEADRLVTVLGSAPGSDLPDEFGLSAEFYVQYQEESELVQGISFFNTFTNTLRVDDRTERVWMSSPTHDVFETLGVEPILGRLPTAEDEDVFLISHALWTSWFGADPSVVGNSYYAAGGTKTLIGVMAPDFWFPNDQVLLWAPYVQRDDGITPGRFGQPLVARLAPGATRAGLADELQRLAARLPERFGGSANYARIIEQHRPVIRPIREQILGSVTGPLWVLLGAVGVVLLIACANVANLFLVRAEMRQRDLAVRRAIGAGRGRLFRTLISESVVVAGAAGVLAVILAWVTVPLFVQIAPDDVPRLSQVGMAPTSLAFTFVVSLVAALLCGLVPALRAASPNLSRLRDGERGSTGRTNWARNALVAGQTSLALVLLIGSALLVRSWVALRDVDPGSSIEDIFTFQIAPENADRVDGPSFARFDLDFIDRLAQMPGVESVGLIENVPLNEGTAGMRFRTDETLDSEEAGAPLSITFTAGDYFPTMDIALLRGRHFGREDHLTEHGNVVISETAANLLFPGGEDPVGRRIRAEAGGGVWMNVVGVVEDVLQYGFRGTPEPLVYLPLVGPEPRFWAVTSPAYVVKTSRADLIAPEIREIVREIAPGAPMYRMYTMEGLAADSMAELSFTMLTLGVVSVLALLLGALGLFGVLAYTVAGRTREIGVRMALGAEARRVQGMVVGQGARVVLVGVIIGLGVAAAATRLLDSLLFGVQALDPAVFVAMPLLMMGVGFVASYIPARKASGVDPILSLRGE
jgi:predicted permease